LTESSGEGPDPPGKRRVRKRPNKQTDDLRAFLETQELRFESLEKPDERRSRLSIKEAQARHELWRDKVMIFACLIGLSILGLVSILFLFLPGQPSETRTWAIATPSAIVSGVVTYSLGRTGKTS
jgi:hypothetical protein